MTAGRPSPEAIARAGRVLAEAQARAATLTPEQLAAEAFVPGGPSVDELTARIRQQRAEDHSAAS